MRALDRKLVRTLWRIKGQVLAIALVVASGVAMFIMALTALRALQESRDAFYEQGRFGEVFAHLERAPLTLKPKIAAIPGVRTVELRVVGNATLDVPGTMEPVIGRLVSLPPDGHAGLNAILLRSGRLPGRGRDDEVVVSEAFALAHGFRMGESLSAVVNGRQSRLRVVGVALSPEFVYAVAPGMLMPDDRRYGVLWMDEDALAAAYDLKQAFNDVVLRIDHGAQADEVMRRLDLVLERYGGLASYPRDDQVSHALLSGELDQLRALSKMVPPVFLGIAAFLLNVMISRLVAVEREQIGLMKACGYHDGAIARHYLALTLVITAIGAAIGVAGGLWLGSALTGIYGRLYHFPVLLYEPVPWVIAAALLIAGGAGTGGALAAAARAARLPPATAMMPAPPTAYRDLAPGLARRLTQPSRIILRNILRWPLRSALTVLGIALAMGDIVASLFGFDSVDRMIDLNFFTAQRYEALVTFTHAKEGGIVYETGRLPGVVAAEPFRAVAVRLRHGHRSKRTSITGLVAEPSLHRIVDAELRVVAPPRDGLLVSPKLAEVLAAAPGDVLTVEVLEGERQVLRLPVAAIVEEYLGTPAYMDLAALNRALGEGVRVSGAYLLVDAAAKPALFARLKETPGVATVSIKSATLESFRRTMAESMEIMLIFYIGFGAVIALGVLYNSARIALSERARELATLRVLGFTRFEVSYILLGELTLLTVAALPLGCVLGYGWAWSIVQAFENDMFIIPLVIDRATYGIAALTVLASALLAGWLVRRRIDALDMVAVLKTRE